MQTCWPGPKTTPAARAELTDTAFMLGTVISTPFVVCAMNRPVLMFDGVTRLAPTELPTGKRKLASKATTTASTSSTTRLLPAGTTNSLSSTEPSDDIRLSPSESPQAVSVTDLDNTSIT